jgi:hypothetical protein
MSLRMLTNSEIRKAKQLLALEPKEILIVKLLFLYRERERERCGCARWLRSDNTYIVFCKDI